MGRTLSIRADIPSGPLALDVSSDCNISETSDLVHSSSCGQTLCIETLDADGTRGDRLVEALFKKFI